MRIKKWGLASMGEQGKKVSTGEKRGGNWGEGVGNGGERKGGEIRVKDNDYVLPLDVDGKVGKLAQLLDLLIPEIRKKLLLFHLFKQS